MFSYSFIVSFIAFRLMIHFELIFMYGMRQVQVHFFSHPTVTAPSAEKTFLSQLNSLSTFVKYELTINIRVYFQTLSFVSIIYMSILPPLSQHLYDCAIRVSFAAGECKSNFVVLFQNCFGYSRSIVVHVNFMIDLPISILKSLLEFLFKIALNLQNNLERSTILTIQSSNP